MIMSILRYAARNEVLAVTFLLNAVLIGLVFPNIPTAGGVLLDLLPSYDRALIDSRIAEYGDQWRVMHIWGSLTVDAIFPIVYGLFFIGLIWRFRIGDWGRWLTLPVFLLIWVDYAENLQIAVMLMNWPNVTDAGIARASLTTGIKGWLVYITLITALVLVVRQTGLSSYRAFRK